jgi:urease accessory protein
MSGMSVARLGTWEARLSLSFQGNAERTYLGRTRSIGPYLVQRPFAESNGTCQVYLLHPPGGVAAGDSLHLNVDCSANTRVLLTTPAATKLYRSGGKASTLEQSFALAPGAILEWLPQETIVFDGAFAHSRTRVALAAGAHYAGWEISCLGRRAASEAYLAGRFKQSVEVWREDEPLLIERCQLNGRDEMLQAAWGMRGCTVTGTFVCTGVTAGMALLSELRQLLPITTGLTALTQIGEVLIGRYLGDHADEARRVFECIWAELRPRCLGRAVDAPRVWAT